MTYKRKTKPAAWVSAFPKQAKALHPDQTEMKSSKAQRQAIYRAIEVEFMANHQHCEVCLKIKSREELKEDGRPFFHEATEPHHTRGRSGLLLFDVRYWLATCRIGHEWIHNNPDAARTLGLLEDKGEWNPLDK